MAETDFLDLDEGYLTLKDGRRKGQQRDTHEWLFIVGDWQRNERVGNSGKLHNKFIWMALCMTPGFERQKLAILMTISTQERGKEKLRI